MKVLVTGSGAPGWFATYSVLKERHEIFGSDIRGTTSGASLVPHKIVPAGNDPDFVSAINEFVVEEGIDVILPIVDTELVPLAKAKSHISCKVCISDAEALEKALDKSTLARLFDDLMPATGHATTTHGVKHFIDNYSDGESCFIKLNVAHGSRGTKKVVSDKVWLEAFSNEKPGTFGMLFPLSKIRDLPVKDFMLQETLTGKEYSVDCVFDGESNLVFYGVREREIIRNGICHVAKFITDNSEEFFNAINIISNKIKFKYNVNIQFKRDRAGKLKLLEINPRVSGSLHAFHTAGFDLINLGIDLMNGEKSGYPLSPLYYPVDRTHRVSTFV